MPFIAGIMMVLVFIFVLFIFLTPLFKPIGEFIINKYHSLVKSEDSKRKKKLK